VCAGNAGCDQRNLTEVKVQSFLLYPFAAITVTTVLVGPRKSISGEFSCRFYVPTITCMVIGINLNQVSTDFCSLRGFAQSPRAKMRGYC
jgi:hypothetical protein